MSKLTEFLSVSANFQYICDAPNDFEKKRRIEQMKTEFESQSKFSSVNFNDSGYIEDSNGVPDLDENFAAERALLDIRRHIIRADLEKSLTGQIQAKNEITRRNKQRKLEFEKQLQKNY